MKYRKDITDYLVSRFPNYHSYNKKEYSIYEQDGFLYKASYDYENEDIIEFFTSYDYIKYELSARKEIEEMFNVKFAEEKCDIVCMCGESKNFSAHYGEYEIFLRCNSCGNKFCAYSG